MITDLRFRDCCQVVAGTGVPTVLVNPNSGPGKVAAAGAVASYEFGNVKSRLVSVVPLVVEVYVVVADLIDVAAAFFAVPVPASALAELAGAAITALV